MWAGIVLLTGYGTRNTSGPRQPYMYSFCRRPIPYQVCVVVHLIPPVAAPSFPAKVDLEGSPQALTVRLAHPPAILSISLRAEKAMGLRPILPFTIQPVQVLF